MVPPVTFISMFDINVALYVWITFSINSSALDDEVPEYDLGLAAELRNIKDDVVDADGSRDERESIKMSAPAMRSEPLGTVFIERKSKHCLFRVPVGKTSKSTIAIILPHHKSDSLWLITSSILCFYGYQ